MPEPIKTGISNTIHRGRLAPARTRPAISYPEDIADREELHAFLADTDIFGEAEDEGANYLFHALERFRITLAITPGIPQDAPVLELGSNPYFFTRMLLRRGLQVRSANWFGTGYDTTGVQTVASPRRGETRDFEYDHFNIELDRFPYPDGAFRLVFFCEILEHLAQDPVNALAEIHRVLDKTDGWLVLSTPNPVRTENLVKMLAGDNVYEPISGYGVNGRHNREYTVAEMEELLEELGFELERVFTADVSFGLEDALPDHPLIESGDRGEYVFAVARATGPDRWRYPDWLYQSKHAFRRVVLDDLEVGRNDDLQSSGLHPRETLAGRQARWTSGAANQVLLSTPDGGVAVLRIEGLAAPIEAGDPLVLTAEVGDQAVSWTVESGSGPFTVEAPVRVGKGEQEVVLSTDRVWRPVDVGMGADTRELGVAVHAVSISRH